MCDPASPPVTGDDVRESTLETVPAAALADRATAVEKVIYRSVAAVAPPRGGNGATAACDPGTKVVGGGARVDDQLNAFIVDGFPDAGGTIYTARVGNSGDAPVTFTVFAICTAAATVG